MIYDINGKKILNSINYQTEQKNTKYIFWSKTNSLVALICKKNIYIYSKTLSKLCVFEERFNIKSLIWTKVILIILLKIFRKIS